MVERVGLWLIDNRNVYCDVEPLGSVLMSRRGEIADAFVMGYIFCLRSLDESLTTPPSDEALKYADMICAIESTKDNEGPLPIWPDEGMGI